jgi:hypothetical protein
VRNAATTFNGHDLEFLYVCGRPAYSLNSHEESSTDEDKTTNDLVVLDPNYMSKYN